MANLIRFENSDIVNDVQKVVTSTWTNNTNNLTTQFTSSTQAIFTAATSSGAHFIEVFNDATVANPQFAVAYGHKAGSGSLDFTSDNVAGVTLALKLPIERWAVESDVPITCRRGFDESTS